MQSDEPADYGARLDEPELCNRRTSARNADAKRRADCRANCRKHWEPDARRYGVANAASEQRAERICASCAERRTDSSSSASIGAAFAVADASNPTASGMWVWDGRAVWSLDATLANAAISKVWALRTLPHASDPSTPKYAEGAKWGG